jgi:precorrin-6A/cobalt-precorrin-6A reductase
VNARSAGAAPRHVLILGGTTEGRELARELVDGAAGAPMVARAGASARTPAHDGAGRPALRVTSSLAGRVAAPRLPAGEVRIGGFGGPEGLARWLVEHRVDRLIDATHPFAGVISANAAVAAAAVHVPLLALRRPGWVPGPGDDWHDAASPEQAARMLPGLGRRIFLTTGRQSLPAFAGPGTDALTFLVRCVDPPEPPYPKRMSVLLDRGPFTLEGETELLRRYRIDVLVTKDSGGAATSAKLLAARAARLPVVVVRRPPAPAGVPAVATVAEAAAWARRPDVPEAVPGVKPDVDHGF